MRIVYMGTPDFAAVSLKKLIDEKFDVVGVFTQPDKPKGRGMKLFPCETKQVAVEHNLPVYQPEKLRDGTALEILRELQPDILVVVAYGRLLPNDILETIGRIVDCKLGFIQMTDPKHRRWLGDACYDLTDSDEVFGAPGFRNAVVKASAKRSLWDRITGRERRYEIYTWQTYRTIPD